jgi:lipopolysaccharide biosynthesis glycosyltransferase
VVVCSATDGFVPGLAVMVRSLIDNLREDRQLNLFILDGGIRSAHKQKVVDSWALDRVQIEWIRPPTSRLKRLVIFEHFGIVVYFRILIPDLLPTSVRRALYIDCDTLVLDDVGRLWESSLAGHCLGAVQDLYLPRLAQGLPNHRRLGLSGRTKYFNSGVLLMDLDRWRRAGISEKVLDYIERHGEDIRYPDQDGLNAVLAGKWAELDVRWNSALHVFMFRSWRTSPYDRKTYFDLLSRPSILHFTGGPKPWQPGCQHPRKFLFFHYLDRTEWAGWRPRRRPAPTQARE